MLALVGSCSSGATKADSSASQDAADDSTSDTAWDASDGVDSEAGADGLACLPLNHSCVSGDVCCAPSNGCFPVASGGRECGIEYPPIDGGP